MDFKSIWLNCLMEVIMWRMSLLCCVRVKSHLWPWAADFCPFCRFCWFYWFCWVPTFLMSFSLFCRFCSVRRLQWWVAFIYFYWSLQLIMSICWLLRSEQLQTYKGVFVVQSADDTLKGLHPPLHQFDTESSEFKPSGLESDCFKLQQQIFLL